MLAGQQEDSDHDEFDSSDDDLMGGSVATNNTRRADAASNQAVSGIALALLALADSPGSH